MEKFAVIQPSFTTQALAQTVQHSVRRPVDVELQEALNLTQAIDLAIGYDEIVPVRQIHPGTLFGKGTVERLGEIWDEHEIEVVFINTALTPIQQRNLEVAWKRKVIDRQGLILDIFSARAQTREGKLQVELAALTYQRSRLVKAWSHLERQRGGLGKTGGPGETQKELDRRMIDDKIRNIKKDLEKVMRNRDVQRAARDKVPFPVVALVGYTNAGKSTLFNTVTKEQVFAKDLLFATLDTTLRAVKLPSQQAVIFSDTVGFISNLPTDLVAAFRATLEETVHADLILHVRDIASEFSDAERDDVLDTLALLKIDSTTPIIEVWNKADLLDDDQRIVLENSADKQSHAVLASALTGMGIEALLNVVDTELSRHFITTELSVPYTDGQALAWLYRHGHVLTRTDDMDKELVSVTIRLPQERYRHYLTQIAV
jgi:GTP-binding protein HflX